jgi:hypothetical protein
MKKLLITGIIWICLFGITIANSEDKIENKVTEGKLAIKLAERLGIAENPSEEKAVASLSSTSIKPEGGWKKEEKVTEKTLIKIQKSLYKMLFNLSRKLKVPAPPTLSLQVLDPPYAPQTIIFSDVDIEKGKATEGEFAKELAKRLGLDRKLPVKKAISLLSSIGIEPDNGWKPAQKATELFVVRIQVSILNMLENVAQKLKISVPPTFTINVQVEES